MSSFCLRRGSWIPLCLQWQGALICIEINFYFENNHHLPVCLRSGKFLTCCMRRDGRRSCKGQRAALPGMLAQVRSSGFSFFAIPYIPLYIYENMSSGRSLQHYSWTGEYVHFKRGTLLCFIVILSSPQIRVIR